MTGRLETVHLAKRTLDDPDSLRGAAERIMSGRCVLFDFDGPLCRLFPDGLSEYLADDLREIVAAYDATDLLSPGVIVSTDPQDVLRAVDLKSPGSELLVELEARLVEGETAAAESAPPTEGTADLVRRLFDAEVRIAVTTNNSPEAVSTYLWREDLKGLYDLFAGHIYGRTDNPKFLKPHPDCLHRALDGLGVTPAEALMFGDTPTDLAAAQEAGVEFVGYVRDEDEAKVMWEAGATVVLSRFSAISAMISW
ncbi:HAD family hydrolase [Streptomyces sp. NPDC013161]|uniref:HAD family hydrolase n=1 Tax=Streptomyces sp. NPDC013161 TaxID=3364862 RepID=UPI003688C937